MTSVIKIFASFALVDDSNAETCGNIADVVFVIDSSRSIWEPDFEKQLEFVKQVVQTLDIGLSKTRIGALTFSDKTVTEFYLNTHDNKQEILDAIKKIKFAAGDFTNTFDALRVLRTDHFSEMNGDRSDVPNIAIVLTDGEPTDKERTVHEANLTREAGVAIFAIGIGDKVNKAELEKIASSPKTEYMHILKTFTELQSDAFTRLLSHKACAALSNDSVVETCGRIADLVFVIDSSSSIWEPDFFHQLDFVKYVVNAFDVGQGKTRIGALTFSNRTITEFHLKKYDSKQDILGAISAIEYAAGDDTNTSDALKVLRTEHFSERNGDRSDVPNIAIVLTDGESNDMVSTVYEANLTREAGIAIFAIGIGDEVKEEELNEIASSPKSDHMHILVNFSELQSDAFTKLLLHKVCNARQGKPVDIIFVLDLSASILIPGFKTQMRFVKSIVDILDIDSGKVQVGLITFSKKAETEFRLGQHKTKNAIMEAIDRVQFRARTTDTSQALSLLLKEFQPGSGSRQGAARIAVVITDGHSKDPGGTRNMARLVHEDKIDVFAIGVGNDIKIQELEAIASKPSNRYVHLDRDNNALNSIKNYVASKVSEG